MRKFYERVVHTLGDTVLTWGIRRRHLELDSLGLCPSPQVLIDKFCTAVHAYSTRACASGLEVHHIVFDLLRGLALSLEKFDCDVSGSVVDEEKVILVFVY